MKKALIFLGLLCFVGIIIYSTSFLTNNDGEDKASRPKQNPEEKHFIDKINGLETSLWSNDSIENIKLSIKMSKNHERIGAQEQSNLLNHLENIESKTIQNSFKVWLNSNCRANLNDTLSKRAIALSDTRINDRKLKEINIALSGVKLKPYYEQQINNFIKGEFVSASKQRLEKKIKTYYQTSLLKTCTEYKKDGERFIIEMDGVETLAGDFNKYKRRISEAREENNGREEIRSLARLKNHHDNEEEKYTKYSFYELEFQKLVNNNPEVQEKKQRLLKIYEQFNRDGLTVELKHDWKMFLGTLRTQQLKDAIIYTREYKILRRKTEVGL